MYRRVQIPCNAGLHTRSGAGRNAGVLAGCRAGVLARTGSKRIFR